MSSSKTSRSIRDRAESLSGPNETFRSPMAVLKRLIDGNQRFYSGIRSLGAFESFTELKELAAKGQRPECMILTCSDSRLPTEAIFDFPAGKLFVTRVAGNVPTPVVLGSLEHAFRFFSVPVCLVLGHTQCGAVSGALAASQAVPNKTSGGKAVNKAGADEHGSAPLPSLEALLAQISVDPQELDSILREKLALEESAPEELTAEELKAQKVDTACLLNVRHAVKRLLSQSAYLKSKVDAGQLIVLGAVYHLKTGEVEFDSLSEGQRAELGLPSSIAVKLESRSSSLVTWTHESGSCCTTDVARTPQFAAFSKKFGPSKAS